MPYPGRPSPPNGPGLYRTPAFIMPLAALCGLLPARPSLCSLKALRSMVDGAMMWLFPVGRAHIIQLRHPVLGAPASLIGSGPPGPSGSGLYTVPGRVVSHSTTATRPTLCALSALRRSVCGETMSTPGALGTRYSYNPPVLVAPGYLVGSELPWLSGSGLYTAPGRAFVTPLLALPRLSYPTSSVAVRFVPLKRCSGASVVRP